MIEKYRPSNGTEGDAFFASWCCRCEIYRAENEGELLLSECCDIIATSMELDVGDPDYPKELRYAVDGMPCCTAFVQVGDAVPQRCLHTLDMFMGDTCN